ncbi:MAG: response regulator [Gammaproteobacteria bacterium]|nr:response regulator [Gammaproteobacteria bacterium]
MDQDSTDKPQVLVVDDSKVIRRAAVKMLGDDYHVHEAVDGIDGWQQLQRNDAISVVFTDMQMPNMNGIELLSNIRRSDDEHLSTLPVIMITGDEDSEDAKRKVFEAGATDFVAKPFNSIDLLSRARSYAHLNRRVSELEKVASHDKITGLFSLAGFEEQGEKALSFALRHNLHLTVVNLEIDSFNELYQAYGKSIAQQVIVAVGKRLNDVMRTEDVTARLGVANYGVLLPLTNDASARVFITRICDTINQLVFSVGHEKINISLAAGYSSLGANTQIDFTQMMQQADSALQQAVKSTTGKKIVYYREPPKARREPVITDDNLRTAVQHILDGNYSQVPDYMVQAIVDKLIPFLDYVENQSDTGKTGTNPS